MYLQSFFFARPWGGIMGVFVGLSGTLLCGGELSDARYRQLLDEVRPSADEPWRTIPWRISLLDAQQAAASDGKPIFIWAMDGHPLGCT